MAAVATATVLGIYLVAWYALSDLVAELTLL